MEPMLSVLFGLIAGGLGGFTLSALGWLESGEPFNPRKNVAAIMVSTMTGLIATVALVQTELFTNPDTPEWQLVIAFATIFGASAGFGSMGRKAVGAANAPEKKPAETPETPESK